MPLREDLAFERSGTEVPYLHTDAKDMDEALWRATFALRDVRIFWDCAKANGIESVAAKEEPERMPSAPIKASYFVLGVVAGIVFCAFVLWCLGVI